MATFNGNSIYLTIDSVNVSAYFTSLTLERTGDAVDVTSGSGAVHRERNAGLKDTTFSATLVYDDANLSTFIAKMDSGQAYTVVIGPEGNTAGKPKHEQSFVITGSGPVTVGVDKPLVVFELSGEGNGAPTTDFFTGGTF